MLDGETNFRSVAITDERFVSMEICPPLIVVGLPNTNRSRDLTPTVATNTDGIRQSGGGERFLSFLEKELINVNNGPNLLVNSLSKGLAAAIHQESSHYSR